MTPRLKKFLIVLLCVIILACTLLPVVQYEISQHYHPLNDTRTVSHSLSILDGMFNHGFNGYLILICPLLSIIAVCVPVPRQHRKWLTCTIIGLSLATYIVLAFVFMDEAFHFSFRDNIEVDYTLLSTSIGIGVFLTTIAYVMCIVITLLPERANANPETQQTVSTTNSSCLTCGDCCYSASVGCVCYSNCQASSVWNTYNHFNRL